MTIRPILPIESDMRKIPRLLSVKTDITETRDQHELWELRILSGQVSAATGGFDVGSCGQQVHVAPLPGFRSTIAPALSAAYMAQASFSTGSPSHLLPAGVRCIRATGS